MGNQESIHISELTLKGQATRSRIQRDVSEGDLVLLTRFPRTVRIGKPQRTAPPILGVFSHANNGEGIETLYFPAQALFELGEEKVGQRKVPLLSRYRTGRPSGGDLDTFEVSGRVVLGLYVGKDEIVPQLRVIGLPSVADLVESLRPPYLEAYRR